MKKSILIICRICVIITPLAWGASYWNMYWIPSNGCCCLRLEYGKISLTWMDRGRIYVEKSPQNYFRFKGLYTRWKPGFSRFFLGSTIYGAPKPAPTATYIGLPMWIPLLFSIVVLLYHRKKRSDDGCCQVCGYSLTGLTTPRCPECGNDFDIRLLKSSFQGKSRTDERIQSSRSHQ